MENPLTKHLFGTKQILRYVKGSGDYGLVYEKGQEKGRLVSYSDNDFARDLEN